VTLASCLFDGQADVSVFGSKFNNRNVCENRIVYMMISVIIRTDPPAQSGLAGGYPGTLLFQGKIN